MEAKLSNSLASIYSAKERYEFAVSAVVKQEERLAKARAIERQALFDWMEDIEELTDDARQQRDTEALCARE